MGAEILFGLTALVVAIAGPLLGIAAFLRVRRLEQGGPGNDGSRVQRLERLVLALNDRVAVLEGRAGPTAPAPGVLPPGPEPGARAHHPPAPAEAQPTHAKLDLESLIAGRWLNRVGLLLVFLAAFFALKWEFDNDVLGPLGRVALWTVLGAGLLVYAHWLLGRGYTYLSEGLTGLGGAVLYLTLYFGWDYYDLFPQAVAFLAMVVVTAALLAIAVGRDSQRIALLALIGGFLTPALTSTGRDAQVALFGYLLILDGGLLVLARARAWRGIEVLAFAGTVAYFWDWYDTFYRVSRPQLRTVTFATLLFAIFTALPVIRARATSRVFPEQVAQIVLNAGLYLLALYAMLWPAQPWTLTLAVLGLAAFHLAVTDAVPRRAEDAPGARMLFAGLALTFVTLAIPIRLSGTWITIAWAVEGAVLVWSGFNARWWFLRASGLTLYAVALLRMLEFLPRANTFLINARFGTFVMVVAAMGVALVSWRREPDRLDPRERLPFAILGVIVNVLAVWALTLEVRQYFQPLISGAPHTARGARLALQLSISLLWTAYASGLVGAGVRYAAAALRWQGLALFALVVGKVFLFDLSFLSGGYRILSSIVLGVVLIAVSVRYQRALAAQRDAP